MSVERFNNPAKLQVKVLQQGSQVVTKTAGSTQSDIVPIPMPSDRNYFLDTTVVIDGQDYPLQHITVDSSGFVNRQFSSIVTNGELYLVFDIYVPAEISQVVQYTFKYVVYEVQIA